MARDALRPRPDYGDLFTIEEFQEMCSDGAFCNSDGTGYYGFEHLVSDQEARPSDFSRPGGRGPDFQFTHVIWFNK